MVILLLHYPMLPVKSLNSVLVWFSGKCILKLAFMLNASNEVISAIKANKNKPEDQKNSIHKNAQITCFNVFL